MEPDRGTRIIAQIAPLRRELLHQEEALAFGRVQIPLHHRVARRTVVDHLDEHAPRHPDDNHRDRAARRSRTGVLDRVGDQF
jgi:hypothetical protein